MLSPPSLAHPLGTDELGRDMLTRTLHGGRISLIVGVFALLVAVTLGTLIGAVAGYLGGVVDNLLMRFTDFSLAFPRIFVLILFAIIFMRPPFSDNPLVVLVFETLYKMPVARVVFVIGILRWMDVARLGRGSFLEITNLEYVESARVLGAGTPRIMFRHILPNALGPIIYQRLLVDHVQDYRALFDRVTLDLGPTPPLPTDERLLRLNRTRTPDPGLEALLFQYGRYLLIASSRPGGLPANLQGKWNQSNRPPWRSDYHTDINLQMNCWLAGPANLSECFQPYSAWLNSIREVRKAATQEAFHTRGVDDAG